MLGRLGQADAATSTALGAYNVTRQTFSDAHLALADAQSTGRVAAYLDRQLVDASLTAADAVSLAANSQAKALAATAAMALAAGNIKAASLAVDTLNSTINGVAGVAKSNDDSHEPVDKAARAAVEAVTRVAHCVAELLSSSLEANVEASRTQTAAAVEAVTASRASVDRIRAGAAEAYAASQTAIEAAQTARASDLSDQFTHRTQFTIAAREAAALGTALQAIDRVANFGLCAEPANTREKGKKEVAGLKATCQLSAEVAAETAEVRFFAVLASEAASFDFHTARHAHHESFRLGRPARPGQSVLCSVRLTEDTDKHKLHSGQSYVVYSLRIPGRGATHRGSEPRPTDFSFPTPPLTATFRLSFPTPPVVFPLPDGAFVTAFEAAQDEAYVSNYHVFFSPADPLLMTAQEELMVANQLTAANYMDLAAATHACARPDTVAAAIARQFRRDMEPLGRLRTPPLEASLLRFHAWIKQRAKAGIRCYVLYTNPFATKSGWVATGGFTISLSADLNGDPLVPERRQYVARALAVGSIDKEQLKTAANQLSPQSALFPVDLAGATGAKVAAAHSETKRSARQAKRGTRKTKRVVRPAAAVPPTPSTNN